jgi:hypothetical protein
MFIKGGSCHNTREVLHSQAFEAPSMPTHPPRPSKAPPVKNDVVNVYANISRGPLKLSKMKGGWRTNISPSVLSSVYAPYRRHQSQPVVKEQSRWIGGLKYHPDLEDDWELGPL